MTGLRVLLRPFRCTGTELPAELLLASKLLVFLVFRFGVWGAIAKPFNPFIPAFELVPGPVWVFGLKGLFALAALGLWSNTRVRESGLVAGAVLLCHILSCRTTFQNNVTFTGCVLFCIGLTPKDGSPWIVRTQIALVYICAGLNKLLEPDWRSGQFMEVWSHRRIVEPLHHHIAAALPHGLMSLGVSWATILGEMTIGLSLLTRRFRLVGVWGGCLLHTGLFFLTNNPFGIFYFAACCSYLVFAEWPRDAVVRYSGTWGQRLHALLAPLDVDQRLRWEPDAAGTSGPSLSFVSGGQTKTGFAALRNTLWCLPAAYFAALLVIGGMPQPGGLQIRRRLALAFWLVFSPLGVFVLALAGRQQKAIAPEPNA